MQPAPRLDRGDKGDPPAEVHPFLGCVVGFLLWCLLAPVLMGASAARVQPPSGVASPGSCYPTVNGAQWPQLLITSWQCRCSVH